ncbi:DUF480 domain-containing protein [Thiohalocapsa marina]|uniref:DUF480 domain-containing protein n=1 Tax=Thiohalocapsa marina TaxID=424902 RepID=A0A5M8FDV4_9GAMM|nr:YceH family protein [Thiohalocapsa marina]KAA6182574.1 DUF480 domain-containing protein [Thiohalocapsa marina]
MNEHTDSATPFLTPLEARILGCLMEKQRTTPDQYPLTLNALVTACNQKTARHPVMKLTPGEVGHAVGVLRDRGLIHEDLGGRATRYDHKLAGTFMLDRRQQALLCLLLLRGPQTLGELRTNASRLADFASLEQIKETLQTLIAHERAIARELPRQAGMREGRYAQLLTGEPDLSQLQEPATASAPAVDNALLERVEALEQQMAALLDRLECLESARDSRNS